MIKIYSRPLLSFIAAILLTAGTAHAGKPERDRADELKPVLTDTAKAVSDACGCKVQLGVKWESYATVKDMMRIEDALGAVSSAARQYCEKDADKKAFCGGLSEVEISYGEDTTLKAEGKKIAAASNDAGYSSDNLYLDWLNKL